MVISFSLHIFFLFMHIISIMKWKQYWVGYQETWDQIPVLSVTGCKTLDRFAPTTLDLRVFNFKMWIRVGKWMGFVRLFFRFFPLVLIAKMDNYGFFFFSFSFPICFSRKFRHWNKDFHNHLLVLALMSKVCCNPPWIRVYIPRR